MNILTLSPPPSPDKIFIARGKNIAINYRKSPDFFRVVFPLAQSNLVRHLSFMLSILNNDHLYLIYN